MTTILKLIIKFFIYGMGLFLIMFVLFLLLLTQLNPDIPESEYARVQHARMQAIYEQGVSSLALETPPPLCTPELSLPENIVTSIYAPFLKQFSTQEKRKLSDEDSQWLWLIPEEIIKFGDVQQYFSEWDAKEISSAMTRYIVLIHPDSTYANTMPVAPDSEHNTGPWEGTISQRKGKVEKYHFSFIAGSFKGLMQVVDTHEEIILCQSALEVESSMEVAYQFGHRRRANPPNRAVRVDFQKQFKIKVGENLPSTVSVLFNL